MVAALLGVILVFSGLYVLTRNAAIWNQLQSVLVQAVSVLPVPVWERIESVAAIGALVIGAALILLRLFGGLKRV